MSSRQLPTLMLKASSNYNYHHHVCRKAEKEYTGSSLCTPRPRNYLSPCLASREGSPYRSKTAALCVVWEKFPQLL